MDYEQVLPEDFDGTFRFTNDSDEDFVGRWDSKEYVFPARTTSPITIFNATPLEIQQIRKKFAKDWATEMFYSSDKFKYMNDKERGQTPALYTESDLAPFIQMCLEPLPIAQATTRVLPKDDKNNYRATRVLDKDESLKGNQGESVEL